MLSYFEVDKNPEYLYNMHYELTSSLINKLIKGVIILYILFSMNNLRRIIPHLTMYNFYTGPIEYRN